MYRKDTLKKEKPQPGFLLGGFFNWCMGTYIILGKVGRSSQQKVEKGIGKFICGALIQETDFTILLQLKYEILRAVA